MVETSFAKGELLSFSAILLHCESCGVTTFANQPQYLDGNYNLTTKHPLENAFSEKKVVVANERDWIIVMPSTQLSDLPIVGVHIGGNRLDKEAQSFLLDSCKLSFVSFLQQNPFLLSLEYLGFNNDPRAIWDIPEIKSWVAALYQSEPDFICSLTAKSIQHVMITLERVLQEEFYEPIITQLRDPRLSAESRLYSKLQYLAANSLFAWNTRFNSMETFDKNLIKQYKLGFVQRFKFTAHLDGDDILERI